MTKRRRDWRTRITAPPTNMTDMIAGLAALTRMESPLRDKAFAHFHDRFQDDPLVLDKWMGLQAGSPLPDTVASVRTLMEHPAFDMKNPNRVRALVGAFSANHLRFHDKPGAATACRRSRPHARPH